MNKQLRFKQSNDQRVFWTSDTHLNHDPKWKVPLWEARGHKSSKDMTDFIISRTNEVVRPQDILIHAGDFALNTDESGLNQLLARIQCQNIYMIWGNHNNPLWRVYQQELKRSFPTTEQFAALQGEGDVEVYPFRYKNIVFIGNYAEIVVDGHFFVVAHYPIHVFNYMKDGAKMICGHSHYGLPFSQAENLTSKILDIGWDGFARPLSTGEILAIMNKKSIFISGDHHE